MGIDLYFRYFRKGGYFYFFICLLVLGISCGIRIFADYWLAAWPKDDFDLPNSTYIWSLWVLLAACIVFVILRAYIFSDYTAKISIKIFQEFIANLLKKSMEFFDSTSIG